MQKAKFWLICSWNLSFLQWLTKNMTKTDSTWRSKDTSRRNRQNPRGTKFSICTWQSSSWTTVAKLAIFALVLSSFLKFKETGKKGKQKFYIAEKSEYKSRNLSFRPQFSRRSSEVQFWQKFTFWKLIWIFCAKIRRSLLETIWHKILNF